MTIIVYHKGVLYADNLVTNRSDNFATSIGKKIFIAEDRTFGIAFSGAVPSKDTMPYVMHFFASKLHEFYQAKNKQIPFVVEDFEAVPMVPDSVILITHKHAWMISGSCARYIVAIDPDMPTCFGSGCDYYMAMWALGYKPMKIFEELPFFDSMCSSKITAIRQDSLRELVYVEAK